MITQSDKIDVLGNNIANINTDGFKGDGVALKSFGDEMIDRMEEGVPVGSLSVGVGIGSVSTNFTQGGMEQTGLDTDMGVEGDGFFAVEATPGGGGVKYTREGDFTVDPGGYLELPSGERLLGTDGKPIEVGGDSFAVSASGVVTSPAGTALGTIGLYSAQGGGTATKRTDGFFDIASPTAATGVIKQGNLEDSNVDAVGEMTGMMEATRTFQACQQAFQVNSDTLDKLISQIGSIKA